MLKFSTNSYVLQHFKMSSSLVLFLNFRFTFYIICGAIFNNYCFKIKKSYYYCDIITWSNFLMLLSITSIILKIIFISMYILFNLFLIFFISFYSSFPSCPGKHFCDITFFFKRDTLSWKRHFYLMYTKCNCFCRAHNIPKTIRGDYYKPILFC